VRPPVDGLSLTTGPRHGSRNVERPARLVYSSDVTGETTPATRALARRALAEGDEALLATCEETFYVGGGPGGQHRNKTESGVRLRHLPTGVVVTATERRSQLQNRGAALERLRTRLAALAHEPKRRRPTKATRGSQERRIAGKKLASKKKRDRTSWD
jgi:ribosome-associated protein